MLQLNDRLPAREVRVLMSTLVVSARSGGSLIKALRDISLTLDDRKEVRREVRTTLAQSRATGALVTVMGVGILLALNAIQPGTVERMTPDADRPDRPGGVLRTVPDRAPDSSAG